MQKRANCVNYGYANKDKNSSTFWATPDCPDCFKNLSELGSNNLEGQSSRYIIIGIPNKDPGDKADTRLLVYDKQSQQKVITDLDKYYSEPAGSKRFKFLSPTVAVTTQVEYKDGMPNILRLLSIKFGD
jgi:hypothetical protein